MDFGVCLPVTEASVEVSNAALGGRKLQVPSEESENTSGNPVSFSRSLLASERILPSKSPFPSQLKSNGVTAALELSNPQSNPGGATMKFLHPAPLRAMSVGSQPGSQASNKRIDVPRNLAYNTQPPGSSLRRRNSFPNHHTKEFNTVQPLARKRWSGSQPDLQANVLKETPRNVKLREAGDSLSGQPRESGARNLDLEVDMMEFELSSLRQKGEQISAGPPTATQSLEAKRERRQLHAAYKNIKQKNVALLQQIQHLSLELKHARKTKKDLGNRSRLSNQSLRVIRIGQPRGRKESPREGGDAILLPSEQRASFYSS
ncbi:uncharacterized protein LOC116518889 isoform X2 [Thamnophis elegans]|nr:uncharacterized protein LOC116518889 isoform X2 [Thamnophis elegans]